MSKFLNLQVIVPIGPPNAELMSHLYTAVVPDQVLANVNDDEALRDASIAALVEAVSSAYAWRKEASFTQAECAPYVLAKKADHRAAEPVNDIETAAVQIY